MRDAMAELLDEPSVKIEWSPPARVSAGLYMENQDGMRVIGAAVAALAEDPSLPEGLIN
jgi:hypothetical protein